MRNEKGSLLTETILAIGLLLVLVAGTVEIHRGWRKRHRAILEHRNLGIKKARVEAPEPLPADGISLHRDLGFPLFEPRNGPR
jgi:hypothetical protein